MSQTFFFSGSPLEPSSGNVESLFVDQRKSYELWSITTLESGIVDRYDEAACW